VIVEEIVADMFTCYDQVHTSCELPQFENLTSLTVAVKRGVMHDLPDFILTGFAVSKTKLQFHGENFEEK